MLEESERQQESLFKHEGSIRAARSQNLEVKSTREDARPTGEHDDRMICEAKTNSDSA